VAKDCFSAILGFWRIQFLQNAASSIEKKELFAPCHFEISLNSISTHVNTDMHGMYNFVSKTR
jgi:hypothetical protein